ncbi:MAG TPA: amidohydrolase family protein, partial [Candidatus Dormibacteraeota bacterium]|nr:amidohydrolase family protein [Candidatus Dormibacteraeota bacterium]
MKFRVGRLYDGTLAKPRENVDLTIEAGRILAIESAEDGATYDRLAACATPGLTNAHVHLEAGGEAASQDAWMRSTPNERTIAAVVNARKSLLAGVTTVRDLGSSNATARSVADAVARGDIEGPRIAVAGAVICMTGGHGWFIGRQVDSPWEARKAVREQLHAGATCVKFIATGGVLTQGAVPGNAQLTFDELSAGVDEAHRHGIRAAAHAIGTHGIKNALRAGIDSIEHGHLLDDEAIELFKGSGAYLVPTLTAPTCMLEHADDGKQPPWALAKARSIAEEMRENISRAYRSGVKIAGGSDAG